MALSIVNTTTAVQNTASSTITINVPSGVANGDVLVLMVLSNGGGSWTTPSGWTVLVASSQNRAIYYRVASSEPASYTATTSGTVTLSACMVACTDAVIDAGGTVGGSGSPSIATAITTTANNAFVFDFVGVNSASITFTTPTGYTALASDSDSTSPSYALFYTTQTTAGTTGTVSSTPSTGSARSTLFSIIPGAGGVVNTGDFFFMMGM